jgi:hypothetical protein
MTLMKGQRLFFSARAHSLAGVDATMLRRAWIPFVRCCDEHGADQQIPHCFASSVLWVCSRGEVDGLGWAVTTTWCVLRVRACSARSSPLG